MIDFLKVKSASLAAETRIIRKKERHILANARALAGIYDYRHKKGESRPEMPEKVHRAMTLADAAQKSKEAYDLFWGLTHHQRNVVRKEARDTHIALHFLRGKPYATVEDYAYSQPDWDNIERMVLKYGEDDPRDLSQRFAEWCENAALWMDEPLRTRLKNPSNRMVKEQQTRMRAVLPHKVA